MKVHPININAYSQIIQKREGVETSANCKTISSDIVYNHLNIVGNYNVAFCASKNPFYSIDENGNYQRFTDRKDAEKTLSLAKSNIAECLQGKRASTKGYRFVYASEIETKDKDGNPILDKEKLAEEIEKTKTLIAQRDVAIPVYAIDKFGNCKKFPSRYQAGKQLNVSVPHLLQCLNKELNKTGGYAFALPEEIETTDSSGNIVIDKEKVDAIVFASFEESTATPIYSIDTKGEPRKHNGIRQAARDLSIEAANISRCLKGEQKRAGNYAFVRAEEVETKDTNGRVIIDYKKIKEINKEALKRESYIPVYTIDAFGRLKRHDNKHRAARAIGVELSSLTHCLQGKYNVINGYALAYAKDVESTNEKGETVINYNLLEEKYNEANKNAVYAVYPDFTFRKYQTQMQASEELGIARNKISQCINGGSNKVAGRLFVKASDVETYKDGNVIVNRELLKKFALGLHSSTNTRAVYAFDAKGKYTKHESIRKVSEDLSIGRTNISACLSGEKSSTKGYHFFYADDFEKIDDNGDLVIDYDKLDELAEKINPAIKKRNKKYGKIYALKGAIIQEFKNIREAARILDIDDESIDFFLRNGHNPDDRKNSINGLVFTSELDFK